MTSFALSLITFVAFFIAPVTSLHTTRYEVGPGTRMRDYAYLKTCTGSGTNPSCAHKPSTNKWIGKVPILGDLSGTGSATVTSAGPDGTLGTKYAAGCFPNPFRIMGTGTGTSFFNTGSGVVTQLVHQNVKNPNAAGGDIGFVHDCEAGSGATLISDMCTATGCTDIFVPTRTAGIFNGNDFIKVALRKDPTPSYRAQLYFEVLGVGEKHPR